MNTYKVGTLVTVRSGTSTLEILSYNPIYNSYLCKYVKSGKIVYASYEEIKPYKPELKDTKMALFQFTKDDKVHFGHHIATNNQGKYVMELKGSGDVMLVDPLDLQEVTPYTIAVKFFGGTSVYQYTAKPNTFKKGDVYVLTNQNGTALVMIDAVDTKSKATTKEFTPLGKVMLEAIQ